MHSSRAGGARAWERRTSIVLAHRRFFAVGTIVAKMTLLRGSEISKPLSSKGEFICLGGVRPGYRSGRSNEVHKKRKRNLRRPSPPDRHGDAMLSPSPLASGPTAVRVDKRNHDEKVTLRPPHCPTLTQSQGPWQSPRWPRATRRPWPTWLRASRADGSGARRRAADLAWRARRRRAVGSGGLLARPRGGDRDGAQGMRAAAVPLAGGRAAAADPERCGE